MRKQQSINLYLGKHGGRRPNSGRVRKHSPGVAHRTREKIIARTPFHINFKYSTHVQNEKVLSILEISIQNAAKHGLVITHYTLQSNHVHLIGEADNNEILIRGMRSLTNTMVKRIGKGSLQVERYHLHVLRSPTETDRAVYYVMNNDLKHSGKRKTRFTRKVQPGRCWLLRNTK